MPKAPSGSSSKPKMSACASKSDLVAMFSILSEQEKQLVNDCLVIHTLETGDDSFLHLNIAENQERIVALIDSYPSTGVIFDVLRDFGTDDLNSDHAMQETLATISRLVRKKNPLCIPVIAHHAITGKAGAAKATGFDRGSFGRNSKVLLSWARAQINIAPYQGDDNEVLIIASAKCNNAPEFAPFGVCLDFDTMTYERDDSVDIEEWKELVGNRSSKPKKKKTPADLLDLVPDNEAIQKNSLLDKATMAGIGINTARSLLRCLIAERQLFEHKIKRSGLRDEVLISRHEHPPL